MAYITHCKAATCRAEIGMVQLRSGKWHPVESLEPEEYRVWTEEPIDVEAKRLVLITPEGEILIVWQDLEPLGPGQDPAAPRRTLEGPCRVVGSESHFAACPEANTFRRGRR